jgi:hypothetical protein
MRALIRTGFLALVLAAAGAACGLWWLEAFRGSSTEPILFSIENDQERAKYLQGLGAEGIKEIDQYGEHMLASDPLNRAGIEALAIARSLRKDESAAEDLMLNAADFSFRNASIQYTAVLKHLSKKNYTKGLYHADGLLRARPEIGEQVYPVFASLLGDKQFLAAISATLSAGPSWRGPFLGFLLEKGGGPNAAYAVVAALRQAKAEISEAELRSLIENFIKVNDYENAYFVWLDSLGERELKRAKSVFDGDFDLEPRNLQFDWTGGGLVNTRIRVVQRPGSQLDRNLSIDFFNETRRFGNVRQFLKLAPGSYKLSYELMARDLKTDGGLVWRTRCLEVPSDIGKSVTHKDSGPWATYSFTFSVPDKGCETQSLTLETESTAVLDAKISGQLNIDKVSVDRVQ